MKTLDEVIKGMEHCHEDNCMECPYQFEPQDFDCITQCQYTDALHYLKEYRDHMKNEIIELQEEVKKQKEMIEFLEKPLTWDELKSMEGKPVWVEWKNDKEWMINLGLSTFLDGSLRMSLRSLRGWHFFTEQEMKDGTWQAYRKERELGSKN